MWRSLCESLANCSAAKPISVLSDPAEWRLLSFAANGGGSLLDATFRAAMTAAMGEFHPVVECDSLLQVRELIMQGVCTGLLPSFGTHGLGEHDVVIRDFVPMKDFGRPSDAPAWGGGIHLKVIFCARFATRGFALHCKFLKPHWQAVMMGFDWAAALPVGSFDPQKGSKSRFFKRLMNSILN